MGKLQSKHGKSRQLFRSPSLSSPRRSGVWPKLWMFATSSPPPSNGPTWFTRLTALAWTICVFLVVVHVLFGCNLPFTFYVCKRRVTRPSFWLYESFWSMCLCVCVCLCVTSSWIWVERGLLARWRVSSLMLASVLVSFRFMCPPCLNYYSWLPVRRTSRVPLEGRVPCFLCCVLFLKRFWSHA